MQLLRRIPQILVVVVDHFVVLLLQLPAAVLVLEQDESGHSVLESVLLVSRFVVPVSRLVVLASRFVQVVEAV